MTDPRHNGGPPIEDEFTFIDEAPPYFPFWWEDFWSSCRGSGMKPDEIGGFLAALSLQWKLAGHFGEAEMRQMVLLTGWDIRTCRTLVAKLVAKRKMKHADGRIANERMTAEIAKFCTKKKAALMREEKKRKARVADEITPDIGVEVRADLRGDLKGEIGPEITVDLSRNTSEINEATTTATTTADTTDTPVHARVPSELQTLSEETYAHSAQPNGASVSKRAKPIPKASADQWRRFWQAYPLRKGKAAAERRFMALSPEAAEDAIMGAERYAAEVTAKAIEPRFVKWAQGWLAERRFEDYAGGTAAPEGCDPEPVDGRVWGWWRGKEDILRGYDVERWDRAIKAAKPNGVWPWWILAAPPGHPECLVPNELVEHYGYREIYRGGIRHV